MYYVILDGSYTSITIPETKCVHVGYSSLIVTCSFSLVLIVKLPVIILFSLNYRFLSIAPSYILVKTLLATSFLQKALIELLSIDGVIF